MIPVVRDQHHCAQQSESKRIVFSATDTIQITDLATNFRYGSRALSLTHAAGYGVQHNRQYHQRFAVSYIKVRGNVDVFNLLNASAILNVTTRYGNQWLQPIQIMGGRLFKFSAQLEFRKPPRRLRHQPRPTETTGAQTPWKCLGPSTRTL